MARLRRIEFLGGPLDGETPPVAEGQDCVVVTDGANVYQYAREEIVEGPKVRQVFRVVATVPMPRRA